MNPVIIFRHAANEGPGEIAGFLQSKAISCRLVKVDTGENCKPTPDDYSGLVFMGGPMSANDDLPWIPKALRLINEALEHGRPVLGICLGAQLIAKAAGARVYRNPSPEFGWLPVSKVAPPQAHGLLDGVPDSFEVFHWHGETFDLPTNATHLLKSEACAHQAFALGSALGFQCHPEVNAEMVRDWATHNADLPAPSGTVQSREAMLQNLEPRSKALRPILNTILHNWIMKLPDTREHG